MFLDAIVTRGRTRVKAGRRFGGLLRWLPALALMSLIFYLSSRAAPLGGASNDLEAAAAHICLYGLLALLLYWAIATAKAPLWLLAWQTFALTVLYGAIDEVHQGFVAGRIASEADLALDAAGALLAILLVLGVPAVLRSLALGPKGRP